MNFNGVKCDECKRIKESSNHWFQIGMCPTAVGIWIELGNIGVVGSANPQKYEVHDLCGEACFYKHLGKLLKLNPVVADAE